MVIEILLIISVVLQIVAAIVAIGLIRRTKYNLSWMLFTVALTCMAFMRLAEYVQITSLKTILRLPPEFFVWMGVVTSLCVALGMLLVKRIFNYIASTENQRRISERRILNTVLRTEESRKRPRFSKDLHDGLGPLLSSAKMSVSALAADKTDERSREILRNASYVIDEAMRRIWREISVNLSPHILKDFGLARAVSNFIGRLPHSGMQIPFFDQSACRAFRCRHRGDSLSGHLRVDKQQHQALGRSRGLGVADPHRQPDPARLPG